MDKPLGYEYFDRAYGDVKSPCVKCGGNTTAATRDAVRGQLCQRCGIKFPAQATASGFHRNGAPSKN